MNRRIDGTRENALSTLFGPLEADAIEGVFKPAHFGTSFDVIDVLHDPVIGPFDSKIIVRLRVLIHDVSLRALRRGGVGLIAHSVRSLREIGSPASGG